MRKLFTNYSLNDNSLLLDGYFLTDFKNKYRDQEIEIVLYLPVGSILYAEDNTYTFHRNDSGYRDILNNGSESHYLRILENKTECLDCPADENWDWDDEESNWENELEAEWNDKNTVNRVILNEDGIDINIADERDTLKLKIGN
jgi:hypothetical protein